MENMHFNSLLINYLYDEVFLPQVIVIVMAVVVLSAAMIPAGIIMAKSAI